MNFLSRKLLKLASCSGLHWGRTPKTGGLTDVQNFFLSVKKAYGLASGLSVGSLGLLRLVAIF